MWKILSALKQNLVWSVPAFMIVGIIFGALADASFLKAAIVPLTFLMVYPMMINLQMANPLAVLSFFVPLLIIYSFNFVLSTLIGKALFSRDDAIALVYGTVMRNLSIALAIAITVFGSEQGSEIALIIAMGYIIQVQSAAWYVKLTNNIFGTPAIEA